MLAQAAPATRGGFQAPSLDYHALAPEIVLAVVIALVYLLPRIFS